MIHCCKDCVPPKRHPRCHIDCPEYLAEKKAHEQALSERHKKNEPLFGIIDYQVQFSNKIKKKNRRRW